MSGLILPALETPKVSRRHRLAAKARDRREGQGSAMPNMQVRPRGPIPAAGCQIVPGPIGPMLVLNLADGQQAVMPFTFDQARAFGIALISGAAQMELLKAQAEQEADGEPVPTNPELEQFLADAQANTADLAALKGDDIDDDDDTDLATEKFNAFDVNGQPCWEEPTAEEAG